MTKREQDRLQRKVDKLTAENKALQDNLKDQVKRTQHMSDQAFIADQSCQNLEAELEQANSRSFRASSYLHAVESADRNRDICCQFTNVKEQLLSLAEERELSRLRFLQSRRRTFLELDNTLPVASITTLV